jgi:hypothetical protein
MSIIYVAAAVSWLVMQQAAATSSTPTDVCANLQC